MYADDLVIYHTGQDANHVCAELQNDLNRLGIWCDNNNLLINVKKTKVMWLGSRQKLKQLNKNQISIHNSCVPETNTYKYLGVYVDPCLSFTDNVKYVIKRTKNVLFRLEKIRKYIDCDTALLVYKQTVLPYLDYCSFLHGSIPIIYQNKLQRLQNRGLTTCICYNRRFNKALLKTRTNKNKNNMSVMELHNKADLLTVSERCNYQLLVLTFQLTNKLQNQKISKKGLRSEGKILISLPRPRTTHLLNSPLYRAKNMFNSLPDNVKEALDVTEFKLRYWP